MLARRIPSRRADSVYGRFGMSSTLGIRDRPTTLSSSALTLAITSGCRSMNTFIHSRVVFTVSMPAEKRSETTCIICWSEERRESN